MREALGALPGVKQVQVDFDKKQATLLVNPQEFDESRTAAALEQIGFGGKVTKK